MRSRVGNRVVRGRLSGCVSRARAREQAKADAEEHREPNRPAQLVQRAAHARADVVQPEVDGEHRVPRMIAWAHG